MNPLNKQLRQTFYFSSTDLLANRAGRLSPRQQARQQASGVSIKYGMLFFVIVMVGTLGVIVYGSLASGTSTRLTSPEMLTTLGIAGGVISLVVLISLLSSQKYLATVRGKIIQKAEGEVQHGKIQEDKAYFEIKIGRTKIRLLTQEQLDVFQVGTAYRIYFLPGPVPTILSGEVIGTEAEAEVIETEGAIEGDEILQRHRRARPIIVVLAVLTLGIPLAGFASASLPESMRCVFMAGLLGLGILFVVWALRRMST